jgi:L-lysine exporter family protein LysE/ArgO
VAVLGLTFLNPHVYLDTILLVGTIGASFGADRWWFALGAAVASLVWFSGLGFGARLLSPLMARPITWRVLDAAIGVVMLTIAIVLVRSAVL